MSTPNLAELQHQFRDALHYQPHDLPLGEGVAEPEALLQVYRNNFVMTLTECLEAVYPVVNALVGEECFQAVSRHHVLSHPMTDACAESYGGGFNDTIMSLPNIVETVPYLADMAALEWHIQCVSRAPMPAPFPMERLAKVEDEAFAAIQLQSPASVAVLPSDYAVGVLWQAISDNDETALSQIDINQPQTVLVQKQAEGVVISTLNEEDAQLILACQQSPLGDVDPTLLQHLSGVMQSGIFSDFVLVAQ